MMKLKNVFTMAAIFLMATSFTLIVKPSINTPSNKIIKPAKKINAGIETEDVSFAEFLSHFEKKELPFEIRLNDFEEDFELEKRQVNKNFSTLPKRAVSPIIGSKFLPETAYFSFSRRGGIQDVQPVARFYPNEKTIAVVYATQGSFTRPGTKEYDMLVYDLKGNILSQNKNHPNLIYPFQLATGLTITNVTVCSIDKNGFIWKNTYDKVWKKDVREHGYQNNEIIDYKLNHINVFKIDDKGLVMHVKNFPANINSESKT